MAVWLGSLSAQAIDYGPTDFQISSMGTPSNTSYKGDVPSVAYNARRGEFLVVWQGDSDRHGLADNEYEIFGQRIDADTGLAIGSNDFQISFMGGANGDASYGAGNPDVAYNSEDDEYLVVWRGEDNRWGLVDGETEIFGQRLSGAGALPVGSSNFQISDVGGANGNPSYDAWYPTVAYNSFSNEYLVVWKADDTTAGLADGENEIFGQRLLANGTEVGSNDFQISNMGGANGLTTYRADWPDVVYNPVSNEYLVVWEADDNRNGVVDGEIEIFGQRLNGSGEEVGSNDFRISSVGTNTDVSSDGYNASVACNTSVGDYLVVWRGDDSKVGLADNQNEIFGQLLNGGGSETGSNDFQISSTGPLGNDFYDALKPSVVFNAAHTNYLVVWEANPVYNETEIYGQFIDGAVGLPVGEDDFRISAMGADGDTAYDAGSPALAATGSNDFCIAWSGDDNQPGLVVNEEEIFGQLWEDLVFQVTDVSASSSLDITAETSTRYRYTLYWTTNVTQGTWQVVPGQDHLPGNSGSMVFSDTGADPSRLYSVGVTNVP